jgi:hypothetical protein
MARFNSDYPVKATPSPSDRVWGLNISGANNRGFNIGDIINLAGIDQPEPRPLSVDLVITSATAGILTASWVSNTFITRSVTDQAVVFIGAPAADNFRFDNVLGNDDGTITVQAGTPATTNPTIPTAPAGSIVLKTILWNELGDSQVIGGASSFPEIRFASSIEVPNTTGKYAKIWEGNLSRDNNYQIHINYGAVSSSQDWSVSNPGKSGLMVLNWLCASNRNILTNSIQFFTVDTNSEVGDFVLVQLPGFRAALFHKSTDFYMRLQFRVVFNNTAVRNQDFISNGQYEALPSGSNWSSAKYTGGTSYTHPNHSGDVTSVGDGATTIVNDAVTNAKAANMPANSIKGNNTGSSADPKDLSPAETRALLNVADGATANTGTVTSVAVTGTDGIEVDSGSLITGAGTITLGLNATTIKDTAFPEAELRENNAVLFDKNYIIGNAGFRTGNITFDFTGAKLGATTVMRHKDAGAFTIPSNAELLAGEYDGTVDNYLWFVLRDKTASTEKVQYTISQIQP